MKAVLPAIARQLVEPGLPADLAVTWVMTPDEAAAAIVDADIAWVDLPPRGLAWREVRQARNLRWLFTAIAGIELLDLAAFARAGTILTNGSGILATAVAEYAVMGVLVAAKRYDQVVRGADRHEWPDYAPGTTTVAGSAALVIGLGAIGQAIADKLRGLGVAVTGVTRSGRDGTLKPDQWRARLGEFDWVVLAAPSTGETAALIGTDELAAMQPTAWIVNIARGDMIDQDALVAALQAKRIGGAFLDPTEPEPLPPDHPLWTAPNALLTMHLSGRSQTTMFRDAARLFLDNLARWRDGRELINRVDLTAGY